MKKKILISVVVLVVALGAYVAYSVNKSSKLSPRGTTSFNAQGLEMKVDYGRPSKRGRLIFGEEKDNTLQPYGKYWRLGANAATEITFSKNVTFGGKPVNAGTYRMYTVPNVKTWQVVLNSEVGVAFGASEPDHELDVVTVEVPVENIPAETEQLTIDFATDTTTILMNIMWDKVLVRVPIALQ
ncbi:MAG: DUF2911 domain-containing protein [Cyclobacteriaceae bacterium]